MSTLSHITALGGSRILGIIDSPLAWVAALENGLPIEALDAAIQNGILTREESEELIIQRRTLSRRRQHNQRLTLAESERLSRIARLTACATQTFGDQTNAVGWLREPNGGLGGARPLDLLRSGEGTILVEQALTRLDHGVYT